MLTEAGIGPDPAALLEELEAIGLAAVRELGEASTAELTAIDPRLGLKMTISPGKSYEGTISVSQKVFFHLALDGLIGRGRPRGSWIGSQTRWSPIERWLPDGIAEMPVDDARAELVRRWLRRSARARATTSSGGRAGRSLPRSRRWRRSTPSRWISGEVGSATSSPMTSSRSRSPSRGSRCSPRSTPRPWAGKSATGTSVGIAAALFDNAGNAGPTIWVDGRIVGGWAQRRDGEIAPRLLEDVGAETTQAIDAEAARLAQWIGPVSVRAMYPSPVEIELKR